MLDNLFGWVFPVFGQKAIKLAKIEEDSSRAFTELEKVVKTATKASNSRMLEQEHDDGMRAIISRMLELRDE